MPVYLIRVVKNKQQGTKQQEHVDIQKKQNAYSSFFPFCICIIYHCNNIIVCQHIWVYLNLTHTDTITGRNCYFWFIQHLFSKIVVNNTKTDIFRFHTTQTSHPTHPLFIYFGMMTTISKMSCFQSSMIFVYFATKWGIQLQKCNAHIIDCYL